MTEACVFVYIVYISITSTNYYFNFLVSPLTTIKVCWWNGAVFAMASRSAESKSKISLIHFKWSCCAFWRCIFQTAETIRLTQYLVCSHDWRFLFENCLNMVLNSSVCFKRKLIQPLLQRFDVNWPQVYICWRIKID